MLYRAELLEKFLQKRHPTHKRYSGEGSEALIVALNTLLSEASNQDSDVGGECANASILGMPHRGRLATLVVLNDYPMRNLLHKVAGNNEIPEEIPDSIDDIPTHIAVSNSKKFSLSTGSAKEDKQKVTLSLVHNPSHLESQNSISMGKSRAKLDDMSS